MLLIGGILTSCKSGQKDNEDYVRIVFDAGGLKFIASSLNSSQDIITALYGNEIAYQSLSAADSIPQKGAILKLVTWRFHDNPQYFGSKINGELLSVESISSDEASGLVYHLQGTVPGINNNSLKKMERINYMMSYRPVLLP